jgi:hypothetical protein
MLYRHGESPVKRSLMEGCIAALIALFPVTALLAVLYRFPILFVGYASGLSAVFPSLIAIIFYGLFGAFPVAAALGAFGGAVAFKLAGSNQRKRWILLSIFSVVSALIVSGTLSVLDKIIGPW